MQKNDFIDFKIIDRLHRDFARGEQVQTYLVIVYFMILQKRGFDFKDKDRLMLVKDFPYEIERQIKEAIYALDLPLKPPSKLFSELKWILKDSSDVAKNNVFQYLLRKIDHQNWIHQQVRRDVSKFMMSLVGVNENDSIYEPSDGSNGVFSVFENCNSSVRKSIQSYVTFNNQNSRLTYFMQLAWESEKVKDIQQLMSDDFQDWNPWQKTFNSIVLNEIYEHKEASAHLSLIHKSLDSLSPNGRFIGAFPSGFFRTLHRNEINSFLQNELIESVINISHENHETRNSFELLVLCKDNESKICPNHVRFIDVNVDLDYSSSLHSMQKLLYYRQVKEIINKQLNQKTTNEISDAFTLFDKPSETLLNDVFKLNPKFHSLGEIKGNPLSDFIERKIIKGLQYDSLIKIVEGGYLKQSIADYQLTSEELKLKQTVGRVKKIDFDCILLTNSRGRLNRTFFKYEGEPVYISNGIGVYTTKNKKIPLETVLVKMYSKNFEEQLNSLEGNVVNRQLLSLKIDFSKSKSSKNILVDDGEVIAKLKAELSQERDNIRLLNEKIDKLTGQFDTDLRQKKHQASQPLSNLTTSLQLLWDRLESKKVLKIDEVMNKSTGSTVRFRWNQVNKSLDQLRENIQNLPNEINFGTPIDIDILKYLKDLVKSSNRIKNKFEIELDIAGESLAMLTDTSVDEEEPIDIVYSPIIRFSESGFKELYDNIIENAVNHGFINDGDHKISIVVFGDMKKDILTIIFKNNGSPFIEGIKEKYHVKGYKAGPGANQGFGTHQITSIAKHFGCEIQVHDKPLDEFPVQIELQIGIINYKHPLE